MSLLILFRADKLVNLNKKYNMFIQLKIYTNRYFAFTFAFEEI